MKQTPGFTLQRVLIAAAIAFTVAACGSGPDAETHSVRPVDGRVDLAAEFAGQWDRVCVLGPYTTNRRATEILGVDVDVYGRSQIASSDGITLLVTMNADAAAGMYEVALRPVDFTPLAGCCFSRSDAVFRVPEEGRPLASREGDGGESAAACE